MCDVVTHNWGVNFNIIGSMENLPRILNIHESTINDARYQWDSRRHSQIASMDSSIFQINLSGSGAFDDGERIHTLTPGTGFLINSGNPDYRYFHPEGSAETQRVLWCNLQSSYSTKLIGEINSRFGYIFTLPLDSGVVKKMMDYRNSGISYSTILASENAALAVELLHSLIWSREKESAGSAEEILVKKALEIINGNEGVLFNSGELAEKLEVSREHLSRVFSRQLRISPYRYIVSSKIELSKIRLRYSTASVKSIAAALGFTSQVQFTELFRKHEGISPGRYRKVYFTR